MRVGIRERSEFKLVERKKIAHGVSRGETARSTKPRHGAKDRSVAIFRPLRGLCGTRPIPMARPWAIFFRPAGWKSVLAYSLRTDGHVFLRNLQSRCFHVPHPRRRRPAAVLV